MYDRENKSGAHSVRCVSLTDQILVIKTHKTESYPFRVSYTGHISSFTYLGASYLFFPPSLISSPLGFPHHIFCFNTLCLYFLPYSFCRSPLLLLSALSNELPSCMTSPVTPAGGILLSRSALCPSPPLYAI